MRLRRTSWTLTALVATAALAVAGCGSDGPSAPDTLTQSAADDLALLVAQGLAAGNGGAMTEMAAIAAVVPPSSGLPAGTGMRGTFATAAALAETTFTVGNITYRFTRAFYDAQGAELAGYGPTAARLRVTSSASGAIVGPRFEGSLGHSGIMDVTGIELESDTLAFQGVADDTAQAAFTSLDQSRTRHVYAEQHRSCQDVRMLRDREANPWPLSGTLTCAMHLEWLRSASRADVEARFQALVVVTFDGTQYPEIEVDAAYRYRVNLNTGDIARI